MIDEYKLLVHPRIAGHGSTLYECGLSSTRQLQLRSAKPLRSGVVAMHYQGSTHLVHSHAHIVSMGMG